MASKSRSAGAKDAFNFENLLSDVLHLAKEQSEYRDPIFVTKPLGIRAFCKDILGAELFPGQQTLVAEVFEELIFYKWFDYPCSDKLKPIQEMVIMWGNGSGKDYIASILMTYVVYVLMCVRDPQSLFPGFGKGENIDLINNAPTSNMAENVFLAKVFQRLDQSTWFDRVEENPTRAKKGVGRANQFHIAGNEIQFFHNIKLYATHAKTESFEGFSPLVTLFDEIAEMPLEKAVKAVQTFSSSSNSRFQDRKLIIYISYPRQKDDYIFKKYSDALSGDFPHVWGIKGATWEVRPYPGHSIESYKIDYEDDPESAKMKYECEPPEVRAGFFPFPELINECIVVGRSAQHPDIFCTQEVIERKGGYYIKVVLNNLHKLDPSLTYYLGGDAGVKSDAYILCLSHGEVVEVDYVDEEGITHKRLMNMPVEDLLIEWRPSKKDRVPVDLINVEDIVAQLCGAVYVKKALFDSFNSATLTQKLVDMRVEADDKVFSNKIQYEIYSNMRSLINSRHLQLLDYASPYSGFYHQGIKIMSPNDELKYLQRFILPGGGVKIDHDHDKTKDFSDARAASFFLCSNDEPMQDLNDSPTTIIATRRKG